MNFEMNFDEIADNVHKHILYLWPEDERNAFFLAAWSGESLDQYHSTLGRWIRNKYYLWNFHWDPEVRDGVDYSPQHPDSISRLIIEEVWKRGPKYTG